MNLKAHYPGFKVWAGAQADIDRITAIWRECLPTYGGPYLFGDKPCMADAMYAPVCTRFLTYDVKLDSDLRRLLQDHHDDAVDAGMDRGARRPNRTNSKNSMWSFEGAAEQRVSCEDSRLQPPIVVNFIQTQPGHKPTLWVLGVPAPPIR